MSDIINPFGKEMASGAKVCPFMSQMSPVQAPTGQIVGAHITAPCLPTCALYNASISGCSLLLLTGAGPIAPQAPVEVEAPVEEESISE